MLFGGQVSIAIENATYFEEINHARQQAEAYQLGLQKMNAELEHRVEKRTAELASANKKLKQMALHDPLTGLPNRTLLMDRLKYSISQAKRDKKQISTIMLDLDRFKEINDTLGHQVGDQLLIEIATRLSTVLRKSDTVGRLGGDEFAIILPGSSLESAELVAGKIIKALETPITLEGNTLSISGSLGIATYPDHSDEENHLLRFADVAMYNAKRTHSGYCAYNANTNRLNMDSIAASK
jgi:diguanylate cyclase (GGDEF)-like protein